MLAAADRYATLTEDGRTARRPTRRQRRPLLRDDVQAGRLDGEAVEAVLTPPGTGCRRRGAWPGGLTNREVEVLRLLALGLTNRQIAEQLHHLAEDGREPRRAHLHQDRRQQSRHGRPLRDAARPDVATSKARAFTRFADRARCLASHHDRSHDHDHRPTRTATVHANGIEIHYVEAGSPDPPDLVLLHGGLVSTNPLWDATPVSYGAHLAALAQRFHVVAPDQRGSGRTGHPAARSP